MTTVFLLLYIFVFCDFSLMYVVISTQLLCSFVLKTTISEYRDTFKGYEQQDSHEFLTILIDGLHEDLNCVSFVMNINGN